MIFMDIPWGSLESSKFATNVGLITSNGLYGNNIMSAEWTHHVSYSPGLIMINVGFDKATEANIKETKEFGVNIAAADQNIVASVSGGSSGKEVDKISVLKELGVEFYKAKKINVLMVKDVALNAECKAIKAVKLGDHRAFVGEVVSLSASGKESLIYHGGKYYSVGPQIEKPPQEFRDKLAKLIEKHKKK